MNRIRLIGRHLGDLTPRARPGPACCGVAVALARARPDPPLYVCPRVHLPPHARIHAASGMPGWQITLIALGAAVAVATAAALIGRARAARQHATDPTT